MDFENRMFPELIDWFGLVLHESLLLLNNNLNNITKKNKLSQDAIKLYNVVILICTKNKTRI